MEEIEQTVMRAMVDAEKDLSLLGRKKLILTFTINLFVLVTFDLQYFFLFVSRAHSKRSFRRAIPL